MQKLCEGYCNVEKRVLRYLKGTQDLGLKYFKVEDFKLIGYTYLNFDDDKENGVLNLGYAMSLGSTTISWRSQNQSIMVYSTIEVKYMAATETKKDIVWIRKILKYL